MDEVLLTHVTQEGIPLAACFSPKRGMNLLSYKVGDIEIIDQSTKALFLERYAGLGSLIGPHFHHRPLFNIPPVPFENLFPHIQRVQAKGIAEPFSHGIARYAPWQYKATQKTLSATLRSTDLWSGVILSSLEGFDFVMHFDIELTETGLVLDLGVEAEAPAVVGLHYYYSLHSPSQVRVRVLDKCREGQDWKRIPHSWDEENRMLCWDATQPCDYGFVPYLEEGWARIALTSTHYNLLLSYQAGDDDHSFQLYRPKEAPYICIEPLSTRYPQKPPKNRGRLLVKLEVKAPSL